MDNIFKVFFSISTIFLLSACDFLGFEKRQAEVCKNLLNEAHINSPLNDFDHNKFSDLLDTRYSLYKEMFEEASEETSIDTDLLAAISFQESQWDPKAISSMGVRGMMMVTLETAAIVGVEKRLNPEQNIKGGAKYLAILLDKNIYGKTSGDQLSISLASYNLGPTNIINIANTIDKEPSEITWFDVEAKLDNINGADVNLRDVDNYSRGQQAIDYVYRIKNYYDLMAAYSCTDIKDQVTFF
jgi:membrane-bound lytic murein transglycosylase F|tara:strand:+ start:85 stop:810 length:726 start_codon:yes stop_codon:yes gene_type:complete